MIIATVAAAALAAAPVTPVTCAVPRVAIVFDPRGSVVVAAGGSVLARATPTSRSVARACARPVSVSVPHTPKPVARRVTVTCAVKRPLEIESHPVYPRGSQLIVAERGSDTWLVSAVLAPGASRVYVFSRSCKIA